MNLSDQLLDFYRRLQSKGLGEILFRDDVVFEMLQGHTQFHELKEQLAETVGGNDETFILLALRALAKQRADLQMQLVKADLVVTFPGAAQIPARHTAQVVREIVENAKHNIIVGGYAITGGGDLPKLLAGASKSISAITVLCDTWKDRLGVSAAEAIVNGWPKGKVKPRIFVFRGESDTHLMHVKTLIADGDDMLVTSANFTSSGMNKNVEFGVRISGRPARDAKAIFEEFIHTGRFAEIL